MITRRREFLLAGAALGIGGAAGRTLLAADAEKPAEEVSAVEDLMREHGVLRRILLIYEECVRRLAAPADEPCRLRRSGRPSDLIANSSKTTTRSWKRTFSSRNSRNAANSCRLVKVLREQHAAGTAA